MDEDWRNTFEILMYPGGGGGRARGMWARTKSSLYKHSHVAYQIKGNEEQNTVVQNFCPGACLGILGPFL